MGRQNSVDALPPDVRRWLDRALTDSGFSGYQELEAVLREKGYVISKSAIHRYGQKIERRLAAIRASTEASKLLADASPDDKDVRSEALTALIQTELFEAIVSLQEAMDGDVDAGERVKMLSAAAKNIATLTRSSVNLKRYQADVREAALREAAEKLDSATREAKAAGEKGLSEERIAAFRRVLAADA